MLQILIHSSKTMRVPTEVQSPLSAPQLLAEATELAAIMRGLSPAELGKLMSISDKKAAEVRALYTAWKESSPGVPAIDAFVGDIYSGLQAQSWSAADRDYAHRHLLVLSGLYGALRACDGVLPYRLEMGYKLPDGRSMYQYWGNTIASILPAETTLIVNLSAVEYTKTLLPYLPNIPVVAPKFLTISPKTGQPTFVTVHTKIARGAFARWLVQKQIDNVADFSTFDELNYRYDEAQSTPEQPVFVCQTFGGIGLSVRLT